VDKQTYAESLEHVELIFNRLCAKKKLGEGCRGCPFLDEVIKLRLLVKSDQFEQIERELGYFLK
jgi:hypothetical protein